jgi:predicted exporter
MSRRALVTLIWCGCVAFAAWVIAHANYRADISAFLPKTPTANQQLLVDQLKDGVVSRLMLVGISGADAATLAALSKQVATTLRADPQWQAVNNGEAVGIERDGKFLLENRYLLSDINAANWQPDGLRAMLEEARQLIAQNAGMFAKELIPRDPSGEVMRMVESLQSRSPVSTVGGVWVSTGEAGTPRAVLMAQTKAAGIDLDGQQRAVAAIQVAFTAAKASLPNASNASIELSGPGVFSALSRDRIKDDATRFSTLATVLVVILIWWVYRSPRVMVLGLLPVASGVLAGIAAVALVFDNVHGITLGFGATLIGEAIDYGVYLFTLIRRGNGQAAPQDAHTTMRLIWPTLRLGVWTSICGFAAMLLSDFPGLQQLGVFSVAGLVAAVLVTRWVLPQWLPTDFQIRPTTLGDRLARIARVAPKFRLIVFVVVGLLIAAGVLFRQQIWNDDLANLSPISLAEQRRDESLRRALGAPDVRFIVVAESDNPQSALEAAESATTVLNGLREKEVIRGFDTPTEFLPSVARQRARIQALPAGAALRAPLRDAAAAAGFSPAAFAPFLDDLDQARTRPNITRASLEGTQLAIKVDALFVEKPGRATVMMPLHGVSDEVAVAAAIQAMARPQVRLMDMKTETNALYQKYRYQALVYALIGVAAIAVLFWVTLRSASRTLRLLFPLAAAVVVTASILIALGVSLSIFHLVAFLLVVGVGSNYALFFDRQWQRDESAGPIMLSLVVCNLSTIFGFGVLAFSSMPVLQAIGGTVAIGAFLTLLFSAVYIQPAATNTTD